MSEMRSEKIDDQQIEAFIKNSDDDESITKWVEKMHLYDSEKAVNLINAIDDKITEKMLKEKIHPQYGLNLITYLDDNLFKLGFKKNQNEKTEVRYVYKKFKDELNKKILIGEIHIWIVGIYTLPNIEIYESTNFKQTEEFMNEYKMFRSLFNKKVIYMNFLKFFIKKLPLLLEKLK